MAKKAKPVSLAGQQLVRDDAGEDIRAVVLRQPHRRGNLDQKCATAWGRFVLRNQFGQPMYDAGEHYRAVVQRWRIIKGIPCKRDPGVSDGVGEVTDAKVKELTLAKTGMEVVMAEVSQAGLMIMRDMTLDDHEYAQTMDKYVIPVVIVLARHLGYISPTMDHSLPEVVLAV